MNSISSSSPAANNWRHQSIRPRVYDYAQTGVYFVTLVIRGWDCLFGEVVGAEMRPNDAGNMVGQLLPKLPDRFPGVGVDEFIVMPNHIHGIISTDLPLRAPLVGALDGIPPREANGGYDHRAATRITPTQDDLHGLRQVVGTYMSLTTVDYLQGVQTRGWPQFSGQLWQRNYYEHVVRSDVTLTRIRQYVREKPAWWEFDRENPTVAQRPPQER